jgi:hypothetical protein
MKAPWDPCAEQAGLAGQSLGFKAIICLIKCDWAESATTIGLRSWAHHVHPCFKCFASGGPLGDILHHSGLSVLEFPWKLKDMAAYEAACDACEVLVQIRSAAEFAVLIGALWFDKRKVGSSGRAVRRDLPQFRLVRGDRLEPTGEHPDVFAVDGITKFPIDLVFWRVAAEGLTRHRNPLFSRRSHVLPTSICGDEMHTCHLGVFGDFVIVVCWFCLDNDVWSLRQAGEAEDVYLQRACLRLRAEIFGWYKAERQRNPGTPLYEVQDVDLSLFRNKSGGRRLDAKAAESGTLMYFAVHAAKKLLPDLPQCSALIAAGDCLLQYMRITRSTPLRMAPNSRQQLIDAVVGYLSLRVAAGIPWKPKCHLLMHMAFEAGWFGNPGLTGTWVDEGLNMQLGMVCRTAHAAVWSMRVLSEYNHPAGPAAKVALAAGSKQRRRM